MDGDGLFIVVAVWLTVDSLGSILAVCNSTKSETLPLVLNTTIEKKNKCEYQKTNSLKVNSFCSSSLNSTYGIISTTCACIGEEHDCSVCFQVHYNTVYFLIMFVTYLPLHNHTVLLNSVANYHLGVGIYWNCQFLTLLSESSCPISTSHSHWVLTIWCQISDAQWTPVVSGV